MAEAPATLGRVMSMVKRDRSRGAVVSMVADRRGGVAVLVGFIVVGLLGMLALAVDVSAAISAHARLRQAADIAALAAVRQAAIDTSKDADASLANAKEMGRLRFLAQASVIPRVGSNQPVVKVTRSGLTITAAVTFNALYQTQIAGALNGISPGYGSIASIPLGGKVAAQQIVGGYVDIQVLMDTSNSMSITVAQPSKPNPNEPNGDPRGMDAFMGATSVYPLWAGRQWAGWQGCSVACHFKMTDSPFGDKAKIAPGNNYDGTPPLYPNPDPALANYMSGPNPSGYAGANASTYDPVTYDYYALARYMGVPMRIDLIKSAAVSIANAVAAAPDAERFQFGFYTFDVDAQQIYGLGQANGAASAISNVEVTLLEGGFPGPYIDKDGHWVKTPAQTNVGQSIKNFAANFVKPAGDGTSQPKAKKFTIIITDGIEDYNDVGGGRYTEVFKAPACKTLTNSPSDPSVPGKAAGVFVLQAADLSNFITGSQVEFDASVAAMKACASDPSYYFLASSPEAIVAATNQIISLALSKPTLIVDAASLPAYAAGAVPAPTDDP